MHRCPVFLCVACICTAGCLVQALPLLPAPDMVPDNKATTEELRLVAPADQAEQLLERAALHLTQGQELEAAALLEKYLEHEPRHLFIRAQAAELYFQQQKWENARRHFQWCIGLSQEFGDPAYKYLIHAHSRLVDVAEAEQDVYAEHLHRGIGLYELACHRAKTNELGQEPSVASILGRAALSLQDARSENPSAARPHWYLHLVWMQLGQHQAARHALLQADDRKFFAELTPWEKRELQMASWRDAALNTGLGSARGIR